MVTTTTAHIQHMVTFSHAQATPAMRIHVILRFKKFGYVWRILEGVSRVFGANMVKVRFDAGQFDMSGGTHAPAPLDPRTLGEGPCGQHHLEAPAFQSNQFACWRRCQRCSLRMEFHDKWNATGTHRRAGHTPGIIRRALVLVQESGTGRDDMTCKKMDGFIKIAEGERMTGQTASGQMRDSSMSMGAPPDGGQGNDHSGNSGTGSRRRPNNDHHDGQPPRNGGKDTPVDRDNISSTSNGTKQRQASAVSTQQAHDDGSAPSKVEEAIEFELILDEEPGARLSTRPSTPHQFEVILDEKPASQPSPPRQKTSLLGETPIQQERRQATTTSLQNKTMFRNDPKKLMTDFEAAAPSGAESVS